jgi:hypothetical protein
VYASRVSVTGRNVLFGTCPSDPVRTVGDMPQWIVLLTVAIVAWFVFSVGGGLVVGRLIRRAESLRAAGFDPATTGRLRRRRS